MKCVDGRLSGRVVFLAVCFFAPGFAASVAAEIRIPVSYRNSIYGIADSMIFEVGYGDSGTALFERWPIGAQMAGTSITIRDGTEDPQYDAFVSKLTNGEDEWLYFGYTVESSGTEYHVDPESTYFPHTDLHGKRVSSIGLTIEAISFDLSVYWIGMMPLFITDVDFRGHLTVAWEVALNPGILYPLLLSEGTAAVPETQAPPPLKW